MSLKNHNIRLALLVHAMLTWTLLPAAMSAMLFLAVLPDLVLGSAVTHTEFLKAATGPIAPLTTDTSSREISSELCCCRGRFGEYIMKDIVHLYNGQMAGNLRAKQKIYRVV